MIRWQVRPRASILAEVLRHAVAELETTIREASIAFRAVPVTERSRTAKRKGCRAKGLRSDVLDDT
jgi:hypothetical protein